MAPSNPSPPSSSGIPESQTKIEAVYKPKTNRKKKLWICVGISIAFGVIVAILLAVLITQNILHVRSKDAAVRPDANAAAASTTAAGAASEADPTAGPDKDRNAGAAKPTKTGSRSASATTSDVPEETACPTKSDIPSADRGTDLDTTTWLDLTDFNCSYTSQTVGGLPLVGLNSSWDNSNQANPGVPPLTKPWGSYSSRPARGVNLGGWLSLEPFITPSLFAYDASLGIVDEYSLSKYLGKKAAATLEKHYATFVTEQDFKSIADAGLDHVRIPFSYWAVAVYDSDPYVFRVSWRYLLRGIEWARKYGLRIKLDLHGLPGSQNSWNHSGRQGQIGFIAGTNGAKNAQRALDIHDQLSKFFAQDRYKNIIAFYGLANEPGNAIPLKDLISWTANAYKIVRENGVEAAQVFSDSLRSLTTWQGELQGYSDSLVLDTHEYVIFDNALLSMKHSAKITFACETWTEQIEGSMKTGFGPTMVGEWSQADTDCTKYLNGVGNGARWIGTFSDTKGVPRCPTGDEQCSCDLANADPSEFSAEYKLFLKTWAQAQMRAFEKGWGWFYWTWKTEAAPLWSYQAGLAAGIMPESAYKSDWDIHSPNILPSKRTAELLGRWPELRQPTLSLAPDLLEHRDFQRSIRSLRNLTHLAFDVSWPSRRSNRHGHDFIYPDLNIMWDVVNANADTLQCLRVDHCRGRIRNRDRRFAVMAMNDLISLFTGSRPGPGFRQNQIQSPSLRALFPFRADQWPKPLNLNVLQLVCNVSAVKRVFSPLDNLMRPDTLQVLSLVDCTTAGETLLDYLYQGVDFINLKYLQLDGSARVRTAEGLLTKLNPLTAFSCVCSVDTDLNSTLFNYACLTRHRASMRVLLLEHPCLEYFNFGYKKISTDVYVAQQPAIDFSSWQHLEELAIPRSRKAMQTSPFHPPSSLLPPPGKTIRIVLNITHTLNHRQNVNKQQNKRGRGRGRRTSLRRLVRRGGVIRMADSMYDTTRAIMKTFLPDVIHDAARYTVHARRTTITATDVVFAMRKRGRSGLYGFGA
ncbi:glucan 1,3-beta-glucosidase [Drechslerella dactyloides]|uniref:glucan 1,3-beta-glucosidase n=1 Tax=Drechslerella dactyloides TaxID=74499 RepID=A0AAD6NGR7_DREDA|nr:glucan 1,3-beta-glucosidase [Drechslerella dactyloides]